jgi:enamine deaminase RidA (YjgF/YER057c/UK114 family)
MGAQFMFDILETIRVSERKEKLEALGYAIDRINPEGALIKGVVVDGTTIYASGQVPFDGSELTGVGKVPSQVSVEEAQRAAALCAANLLRAVYRELGCLEKIERILRITGYVNADPDFTEAHLVINGASELVGKVFGEAGCHARSALGLAQLPLGVCVEVEMILKLKAA